MILTVLLVAAVTLALTLLDPRDPPALSPAPGARGGPAPEDGGLLVGGDDTPRTGIEIGPVLPYKDLPRSFEGRGHVTGVVEVVGGRPFPERWRLVFEPSRFGTGREHAEYREREFAGNQRTFEETDLPLGGYTVRAEAEGLNSRPQELLLFAVPGTPTGGKTRVHLLLHLTPSGFMDGAVRDTADAPVADLPIVLEDMGDRSRRETLTSGAGIWRFDGLRDGRYKLYYGSPERPLIPVHQVNYVAPQRRMDDAVVPVTASVEFVLFDRFGLGVSDARIRGFGRPGGHVVCSSGPDGKAVTRFLPGGRYQVKVDHPDGLEGKANFDLAGNEVLQRVEILMEPDGR